MAKGLSVAKAKRILQDGYIKGKPLTAKQKKYFGAIASGATPLKAINGAEVEKAQWGKILKTAKNLYKGADKFESSIDWAKWNKAIPENKALIKEYNAIEEATKKNGTWMKNSDGSAFKGTPEQFVQENSENFKKAFPNGFDTTTRGDRVHYESMNQGVTFSGDKQVALNYTYNNAQPFTRNSPLGENPNPVGPGIHDSEGLYELYYPKSNNTLKIDGKGNDYTDIPIDDKGLIEYMKGKQVWTDDIAKYIKSKNIDRAIIDNIYDDSLKPGQVIINNNKPGNYLKSIWGNDGMFDMINPSIYRAIVPGAIGVGAASQMGPKQEDGQFKNGGWLDKFAMGGSLPGASGMMYSRNSGSSAMSPPNLTKAQDGTVEYGTPEYKKAYEEGTFADVPNQLDEVVMYSGVDYEKYPYYNDLSAEQRKYFNDSGSIGRGVRRAAYTKRGLAEDTYDVVNPLMYGMLGVAGGMMAGPSIATLGRAAAPYVSRYALNPIQKALSYKPFGGPVSIGKVVDVGSAAYAAYNIPEAYDKFKENPSFDTGTDLGLTAMDLVPFSEILTGGKNIKNLYNKGKNLFTKTPTPAVSNIIDASNVVEPILESGITARRLAGDQLYNTHRYSAQQLNQLLEESRAFLKNTPTEGYENSANFKDEVLRKIENLEPGIKKDLALQEIAKRSGRTVGDDTGTWMAKSYIDAPSNDQLGHVTTSNNLWDMVFKSDGKMIPYSNSETLYFNRGGEGQLARIRMMAPENQGGGINLIFDNNSLKKSGILPDTSGGELTISQDVSLKHLYPEAKVRAKDMLLNEAELRGVEVTDDLVKSIDDYLQIKKNKNGGKTPKAQYGLSGWLDKYQTGGSLPGASGMMYSRTSGSPLIEPGKLKKAQTGITEGLTREDFVNNLKTGMSNNLLYELPDQGGMGGMTNTYISDDGEIDTTTGLNCINGVCQMTESLTGKDFTGGIQGADGNYVGNQTFNSNLEKEGYYNVKVGDDNPYLDFGDVVQASKFKYRASRAKNKRPVGADRHTLIPQHAYVVGDIKYDENGKPVSYDLYHNSGDKEIIKRTLSQKDFEKRMKQGWKHKVGQHAKQYDGYIVNRYDPSVISDRNKLTQAETSREDQYESLYDNASNPVQPKDLEGINKEYPKLGKVFEYLNNNYVELGKLSDVPKPVFDQMIKYQIGLAGKETRFGDDEGFPIDLGGLNDLGRGIKGMVMDTSSPDAWYKDAWLKNANNVQSKYSSVEEYKEATKANLKAEKEKRLSTKWKNKEAVTAISNLSDAKSVGMYQQKEISKKGKEWGLKKSDIKGNPTNQFKASLALMIDNYERLKKQYPDKSDDELVYLSAASHNAPGKVSIPDYANFYGPNKDINYVNTANRIGEAILSTDDIKRRTQRAEDIEVFATDEDKLDSIVDNKYLVNEFNKDTFEIPDERLQNLKSVESTQTRGWLDKYEDGGSVPKAQVGKFLKWGKDLYKSFKGVDAVTDAAKIYKKPFIPRGFPTGSSSRVTSSFENFKHGSNSPDLIIDDINLTEKYNIGPRPGGKNRKVEEINKGISDPKNFPGGFYNSSLIREGFGHPRAEHAPYIYNWQLPKGSRVLELPGTTSNMSIGDLQKYRKEGYNMIKGADITGVPEYLPLDKGSMVNFNMLPNLSNQKVGRTPLGKPASVVEDVVNVPGSVPKAQMGALKKLWKAHTKTPTLALPPRKGYGNANLDQVINTTANTLRNKGVVTDAYDVAEAIGHYVDNSGIPKNVYRGVKIPIDDAGLSQLSNKRSMVYTNVRPENIMTNNEGMLKMQEYAVGQNLKRLQGIDKNVIGNSDFLHSGAWTSNKQGAMEYGNTGKGIFDDPIFPGELQIRRKISQEAGDYPQGMLQEFSVNKDKPLFGVDRQAMANIADLISKKLNKPVNEITLKESEEALRSFGIDYFKGSGFRNVPEYHFMPGKITPTSSKFIFKEGGTIPKAQNGNFGGVNTDVRTTSGESAYDDTVYPGDPNYDAKYKETYEGGAFASMPNPLDEVVINSGVDYNKDIYYDTLTDQEKDLYHNDYSPIGNAVRRKAQTKRGLAEDTYDVVNPLMYGMLGVAGGMMTGPSIANLTRAAAPYVASTARTIGNSPVGVGIRKALNYKPMGGPASLGNMMDAGFADMALRDTPEMYDAFKENPNWDTGTDLALTASDLIPYGEIATGFKGTRRLINSAANKFNDLTSLKPNFTPFERVVENYIPPVTQDFSKADLDKVDLQEYAKSFFTRKEELHRPIIEKIQNKEIKSSEWPKLREDLEQQLLTEFNLNPEALGRGAFASVYSSAVNPKRAIKLGQPMSNSSEWTPELMESLKSLRTQTDNLAIPKSSAYFEVPSQYEHLGYKPTKHEALLMDNLNLKPNIPRGKISKRDRYALFLKQSRQLKEQGIDLDAVNLKNFSYNKNKNVFDLYDLNPTKFDPSRTGFNSAYLEYIKRQTTNKLLRDAPLKNGGVIKDDMGQWAHPGEVTEISGNTMATHGYGDNPLYVVPDVGEPRVVEANTGTQTFPGATKFTEYPMAKNGSSLVELNQLTNFTNYNTPQPGGWLDKYN